MSAQETKPPTPARADDGVSLLSQAFDECTDVVLSAKIAGGMKRVMQQNRRIAELELELAATKVHLAELEAPRPPAAAAQSHEQRMAALALPDAPDEVPPPG